MATVQSTRFARPAHLCASPVPKDVRKVIDYLRARMDRKITTAELASASGVAERTLRKHFREFVGFTPLEYLRRLRLAAVRADLIEGTKDGSITEIAMEHGFRHLGRFSQEYRRCFGETPSSTVRRSRAPPPDEQSGAIERACGTGRTREKPSIVVLPLQCSGNEPSLREFAAAALEGIAVALCRLRSISVVVPGQSSTRCIDSLPSRNHAARYLLMGRITRAGDRLRVSLRLVDSVTGQSHWGDSYDGVWADPFRLQDRVSEGLLRGILPNIRGAEIDRARRRRPEELDAYGFSMRAFPLAMAANPDAARRALDLLNRAMNIDPDYALPTALAAWCHAQLVLYNDTQRPAEARAKALLLAQRAGILDSDDSLVLTARCGVYTMASQFDHADALLARVLAREPTSAWVWERSGWLKAFAGKAEAAIQHFRRAIRLHGSGASNANCFVGLGSAHFHAGRYHQGALWMRRALIENPGTAWVNRTLAVSYARLGERGSAFDALNAFRRYSPDVTVGEVIASIPFTQDFLDRVAEGLNDLGLPP